MFEFEFQGISCWGNIIKYIKVVLNWRYVIKDLTPLALPETDSIVSLQNWFTQYQKILTAD